MDMTKNINTFACERCGHNFGLKANLVTHLKKKNACVPLDDTRDIDRSFLLEKLAPKPPVITGKAFHCKYCQRVFNHNSNRCAHQKLCKEKEKKRGNEDGANTDVKKIEEIRQELDRTNTLVSSLMKEIEILKRSNKECSTNIGTQNITNYTQNIIVNPFGKENTSYITDAEIKDNIMKLREGIPGIIKSIHFNPAYPENRNIKLLSHKQNILTCFDGKQWIPCDRSNTLDRLVNKGHKVLYGYFLKNLSDSDFNDRIDTIREYYQKIILQPKDKEYQCVKREVYMLFREDENSFIVWDKEREGEQEGGVVDAANNE